MGVIVQLPSTCSNVTAALVDSRSAGNPAVPGKFDSAIVKQLAWAAATSCCGLVATASLNREANEYGVALSSPLGDWVVPLPSFNVPFQTAEAVRFMMVLLLVEGRSPWRILPTHGQVEYPLEQRPGVNRLSGGPSG